MAKDTMRTYPQSDHALPHWKYVLRCCEKCPCIYLIYQETYNQYSETTPSIRFYIYHIIGRCTTHGIILLKDNNICYMCKQESSSYNSTKNFTRKEIVMMETTISHFNTSFYIIAIQKLAIHLPHMCILGTNHFGAMLCTAFKRRELFQDVLCCCDYAERVVASFVHQIKS